MQRAEKREYGLAALEVSRPSALFEGVREKSNVWMSHGDHIAELPAGFERVGTSANSLAAAENTERKLFGLQFHPEVVHTEAGRQIIENFLFKVCGCQGDWTPTSFVEESIARIRQQIGSRKAICALSGGVDSTVAAVLVDKAIGENLTCIFVDNGVLRKNEFAKVLKQSAGTAQAEGSRCGRRLLVSEQTRRRCGPGAKRKIIGTTFIEVFDIEAQKLGRWIFSSRARSIPT